MLAVDEAVQLMSPAYLSSTVGENSIFLMSKRKS